ncbi:glutaredoxin family protein [Limosilactobacillus sp. STM2_1]|uniref:Glutaredoxin family protein n=1 Tax=Limosilactobacillus rudii TaxID=2759755 RepID=A0A7W3UL99_9LACO|nr:glutaredoxin family protein [Limosilactobacillus rudii]MBB1078801.1 glutaredoxin family protein [Limosilactobacillus rudii]MBB1097647.1 glutaredoxin family protein [Limosilactobacillus rudii]MCD7134756.1 glutaredoxin family protein [Limosilactobacillus rudii]
MQKVRVYTQKFCPACTKTQKMLSAQKIKYELIDLTADSTAIEAFARLGYYRFPIVLVDDGCDVTGWTGFQPQLISKLK